MWLGMYVRLNRPEVLFSHSPVPWCLHRGRASSPILYSHMMCTTLAGIRARVVPNYLQDVGRLRSIFKGRSHLASQTNVLIQLLVVSKIEFLTPIVNMLCQSHSHCA